MLNKLKYIVLFSLLCLPTISMAAVFSLENSTDSLGVGDQFEVKILIDSEDESINAIEGEIFFDNRLLTVKKIIITNSFVNFWVTEPDVIENYITFSGITPGGFNGDQGLVLSVLFEAVANGTGKIYLQNTKALIDDGLGTSAKISTSDLNFAIAINPLGLYYDNKVKDIYPPDNFQPILTKNSLMFDGMRYVVFSTQDKGSGIDHYEISENGGAFVKGKSPYLLENQSIFNRVVVKAIDADGNERVGSVNVYSDYATYTYLAILLIFLIAVFIHRKLSFNAKKKV